MLSSLLALGLAVTTAEDAVVRTSGCQLHLSASGAISGPVGEISSGQVRAGGGVSSTRFSLQGAQLWDDKGRGCWWTRKLHSFLSLLIYLGCSIFPMLETGMCFARVTGEALESMSWDRGWER
jgi:hypothetical protein